MTLPAKGDTRRTNKVVGKSRKNIGEKVLTGDYWRWSKNIDIGKGKPDAIC
jgi:hypothetical protein